MIRLLAWKVNGIIGRIRIHSHDLAQRLLMLSVLWTVFNFTLTSDARSLLPRYTFLVVYESRTTLPLLSWSLLLIVTFAVIMSFDWHAQMVHLVQITEFLLGCIIDIAWICLSPYSSFILWKPACTCSAWTIQHQIQLFLLLPVGWHFWKLLQIPISRHLVIRSKPHFVWILRSHLMD